jgi:hypothetical protein
MWSAYVFDRERGEDVEGELRPERAAEKGA